MELVRYEDLEANVQRQIDYEIELIKTRWILQQYDFCLIHSEQDTNEAIHFRNHLSDKYQLKGVLESDPEMMKCNQYLDRIEEMISRSSIVFLYVTPDFQKEKKCLFHKNDFLMRYINGHSGYDIQIIPVYPKEEYVQMSPAGLQSVMGIRLFLFDGDDRRIESTFGEQIRAQKGLRKLREEMELVDRERELRSSVVRDVCQRRANGGTDRGSVSVSHVVQVGVAENLHTGNVVNVFVQNSSDVGIVTDQLMLSKVDIKE